MALSNANIAAVSFEKLVPASSRHFAQLARERPKSQVGADSPCNAVRSS